MVDITRINNDEIEAALMVKDLDAAIRPLMDKAGITTGDVAAVCFSSVDWDGLTALGRREAITYWLAHEAHYAQHGRP